jgi:hypothetical protein
MARSLWPRPQGKSHQTCISEDRVMAIHGVSAWLKRLAAAAIAVPSCWVWLWRHFAESDTESLHSLGRIRLAMDSRRLRSGRAALRVAAGLRRYNPFRAERGENDEDGIDGIPVDGFRDRDVVNERKN